MKFKTLILDFYNEKIVKRWYTKWSPWLLAAALALPDAAQFAVDNIGFLSAFFPSMDDDTREQIRYALIAAAFVARLWKQKEPAPVEPVKVDPWGKP